MVQGDSLVQCEAALLSHLVRGNVSTSQWEEECTCLVISCIFPRKPGNSNYNMLGNRFGMMKFIGKRSVFMGFFRALNLNKSVIFLESTHEKYLVFLHYFPMNFIIAV